MKSISPILWTKDLEGTIAFYSDVLGFEGKSNFPDFVSLTKGMVEIMFVVPREEPNDCKEAGEQEVFFPKPVLTGSIFILTDHVDEYWEAVKNKVTVKDPIGNRAYRMRDFSILDNNGYELVFGQDIS